MLIESVRYHFIPIDTAAIKTWIVISIIEDIEQLDSPYIAGKVVKCCKHIRKQFGSYNSWIYLLYDPEFPLIGIYPPPNRKHIPIKHGCFGSTVYYSSKVETTLILTSQGTGK